MLDEYSIEQRATQIFRCPRQDAQHGFGFDGGFLVTKGDGEDTSIGESEFEAACGGGVRRSKARTRANTGGTGEKKPTKNGWFFE